MLQSWLSFDNNVGNSKSAGPSIVAQETQTTNNPFTIDDASEVLYTMVVTFKSTNYFLKFLQVISQFHEGL
jgi:hypothetical protein